jgi:hypothetical protein
LAELPQTWKNVPRFESKAKTVQHLHNSTSAQQASWITSSGVRNDRDKSLPQSWRFLRFSAVVAAQISTSQAITCVFPGIRNHSGMGEPSPPPVRWRHETLNGAPPRAHEEKKKKRREEKKKKRDAQKPSGKP